VLTVTLRDLQFVEENVRICKKALEIAEADHPPSAIGGGMVGKKMSIVLLETRLEGALQRHAMSCSGSVLKVSVYTHMHTREQLFAQQLHCLLL
jgi:hypothetical protein